MFYFAGAKKFNSLPMEIRLAKQFTEFRSLVFDHFQSYLFKVVSFYQLFK